MKKLILSLIMFILIAFPVLSVEFVPRYNDNFTNYGIGLLFGNGKATVYEKPDDTSSVVAELSWDADKVMINDRIEQPKNVFAVFLPQQALSGFIAIGEQGDEYTEIIYDNPKQLTGWVKHSPENKACYWRQLFYKFGKTKF